VTCIRPSLRLLVPSRVLFAPAIAFGWPLVISGGQYSAQSPLQVLFALLSCAQMYSVLPWASTRTRPRLLGPTLTIAPPAANAEAAAIATTVSRATPTKSRMTCDTPAVGPFGKRCI
jgi:hypothetical protein